MPPPDPDSYRDATKGGGDVEGQLDGGNKMRPVLHRLGVKGAVEQAGDGAMETFDLAVAA